MKTQKARKTTDLQELSTMQKAMLIFKKYGDDVPIDQLIEELYLFKNIEEGLNDIREGRIFDNDEVFRELLEENEKG